MLGQKYSIILKSLMYVYHFEPSKGSTRIIKSIFYSGKSSHIFIYSLDLYVECFFCCCRQYNVKDFLLFILLLFWIYKKIQIWYLLTVSTPWEILIFKININKGTVSLSVCLSVGNHFPYTFTTNVSWLPKSYFKHLTPGETTTYTITCFCVMIIPKS